MSKKETVMFSGSVEVWDCIGEACAGHLQGLWDMKQAPSGIPSNGATTSAKSKPKACTSVHFEASVFPGPPWPGL